MRPAFAAALLGLFAPACFDGEDALGLPCEHDSQCGRGQHCEANGICGGVPWDTQSDTQADTQADTGEPEGCQPPPPPTWCGAGRKAEVREIFTNEFPAPQLTRPFAVVAGDFAGDPKTDLAVVSSDTFRLNMLIKEDDHFSPRGTMPDLDGISEAFDILATDRDCNGSIEFLVLSRDGHIAIVNWDETNQEFVSVGQVDVEAEGDSRSFAVGDIVDDADRYPDLVVSSDSQVDLVTNVAGMFDQASVAQLVLGDAFFQPWDTLILDEGDDPRIVVPSADGRKQFGVYDQLVHLLHVTGTLGNAELENAAPAAVGEEFRNPWAVAQGDFDNDGGLEIAVVERNVNSDDYGTNEQGRLLFYYLEEVDAFKVFDGSLTLGIGPVSVEVADLDCDGFDDLVIGNGGAPPTGEYGAPQIVFGLGSLENAVVTDVTGISGAVGMTPGTRMGVGDFNGDGRPEVAIPDAGDPLGDAGERIVFVGVDAG